MFLKFSYVKNFNNRKLYIYPNIPCHLLITKGNIMESRKIIKFGKTSHVVSLPKEWLKNNSLQKGDIIYFDEVKNNLVLRPKSFSKKKILKSIEIDTSKLEIRDIERRIISSYIQNYNVIRLFGKDIHLKSKDIKDSIQNLMALEIMEETSEIIVAKDFLKMEELSPLDLIKRMDIITRAMLLDCIKKSDIDLINSLYERDKDVNRLTFLLFRIIQNLLENQTEASQKGFNPKTLLKYNNLVRSIERIADSCKRISKLKRKIKFEKKQEEEINKFINLLYSYYIDVMKSFYKKDSKKALFLANHKRELILQTKQLNEDYWKIKNMCLLIEKFKDLIDSCHNITRDLYN